MSFLADIRRQSPTVRLVLFVLCVITTTGFVGALWFQSFQQDLYALLNPEEEEQRFFAQDEASSSPFALVRSGWQNARASISNLLGIDAEGIRANSADAAPRVSESPLLLPIAEDQ